MKMVRALLVLLWALFGLTATAHAQSPASGEAMPCHMAGGSMTSMPHMPKPTVPADSGAMPCCSQPVIIAPEEVVVPVFVATTPLQLSPSPARPLTGLSVSFEPRPPKDV